MENPRPEEQNINKDARNLFRLEKLNIETTDTTIENIKSCFKLEKEK